MHTRLRRLTHQRGFTLIEILTVLAIIGILTAILIPAVAKAQERSRLTAVLAEIRSLKTIVSDAASQLGGSLPLTEGCWNPPANSNTFYFSGSTNKEKGLLASKLLRLDHVLMGLKPPLLEIPWTTRFGGGASPTSFKQPPLTFIPDQQKFKSGTNNTTYNLNGNNATDDSSNTSRIECAWNQLKTKFNIDALNTTRTDDSNNVNAAYGINFDLDGNGATLSDRSVYAYVVYKRVAQRDAYQLALALNGPLLMDNTSSDGGSAQKRGPVIYAAPRGKLVEDVYVFLAQF